jgi:hypothetical protein
VDARLSWRAAGGWYPHCRASGRLTPRSRMASNPIKCTPGRVGCSSLALKGLWTAQKPPVRELDCVQRVGTGVRPSRRCATASIRQATVGWRSRSVCTAETDIGHNDEALGYIIAVCTPFAAQTWVWPNPCRVVERVQPFTSSENNPKRVSTAAVARRNA